MKISESGDYADVEYRANVSGTETSTAQPSEIPLNASVALVKSIGEGDLNSISGKRPRDSLIDSFVSFPTASSKINFGGNGLASFSVLGDDISVLFLEEQFQINRLVSQHMEKVRIELQLRQNLQSRMIIGAMEAATARLLRAKEDDISQIMIHNSALEEQLRLLSAEIQIWKHHARSNEAAATALRSDLALISAGIRSLSSTRDDDKASCVGSSSGDDRVGWRCRECGEGEAAVLLLPCRHLCLCRTCGSTKQSCPVCNARNDAAVHVNFS